MMLPLPLRLLIGTLLYCFLASCTVTSLAPPFQLWRPLPHLTNIPNANNVNLVERREALATGAALASGLLGANTNPASAASSSSFDPLTSPRSVVSVESHTAIPVWPSWAGGRVIPMSLGGAGALQDPFLLLAHHDHWFDPRDPLREPFKAFGKTLGLPYVDVEGFKMHPHRGFDIWTYVLDGSDGFRHRDSLGDASNNDSDSNSKLSSGSTSRTYRGGTAQWMRTGAGVLHEEYWETKPDKRTNIELFQLWVNLPATHKFDPPAIRYLGKDATAASHQWLQHDIIDDSNNKDGRVVGTVRNLGATLERAITSASPDNKSTMDDTDENAAKDAKDAIGDARERPPVQIMHATISDPGGRWTVEAPLDHSALIYVRKGSANLRGVAGDQVLAKAQQTATFGHNGGTITIENAATSASHQPLDILLLMAMPLRESVVQAGPIVMNSAAEVNDAYQQLDDGTFLDRDHVLRQQKVRLRNIRYG